MPIYDLSPPASPITNVNVTEDTRGPAAPVTGSPFTVTTTAVTILPENLQRATAAIINTGNTTVLLREGTTPAITATSYTYLLPPNRMWEPEPTFRFFGAVQAITAAGSTTLVVSQSSVIP